MKGGFYMATISITRKIEFNSKEASVMIEAYKKNEKVIITKNPEKIDKDTFIRKLSHSK